MRQAIVPGAVVRRKQTVLKILIEEASASHISAANEATHTHGSPSLERPSRHDSRDHRGHWDSSYHGKYESSSGLSSKISTLGRLKSEAIQPVTFNKLQQNESDVIKIYGVGGEILSTIGKCHLPIKIQGQTFNHSFYVFNKVHCSLIISMDWLKHF